MSYSQINSELNVSKSTLSSWLKDMPLSRERIDALRAHSSTRIEKFRATMQKKKETRRREVYEKVKHDIKTSKDNDFILGFYLYWGEGTKTAEYTVSLTNSDPTMVRCFRDWLVSQGVKSSDMRVKLHLYNDQDEKKLTRFWSRYLDISTKNFNKPYIKDSLSSRKTYKGMFPYGTCVLAYHDRDMHEYVLAGIEYLRDKHKIAE